MGKYNYNYETFKNKFGKVIRARPLTRKEKIELNYNSVNRIESFFRKSERARIESLYEAIRKGVTCCAA